jgi:hypothetical protein
MASSISCDNEEDKGTGTPGSKERNLMRNNDFGII